MVTQFGVMMKLILGKKGFEMSAFGWFLLSVVFLVIMVIIAWTLLGDKANSMIDMFKGIG